MGFLFSDMLSSSIEADATTTKSKVYYFYDDVIQAIGGFGKWQMKVLSVLWLIMFVCGFNSIQLDLLKFSPPEFVCKHPDCKSYDLSWMSNKSYVSLNEKIRVNNEYRVYPRMRNFVHRDFKFKEDFEIPAQCVIYKPKIREDTGECYWDTDNDIEEDAEREKYRCPPGPGNHFIFNERAGRMNLATHLGNVCDGFRSIFTLQVVIGSGLFLGSFTMTIFSCYCGRRLGMIVSYSLLLLGVLLQCCPQFKVFATGTFFSSFGKLASRQLCFIYIVEVIDLRQAVFKRIPWLTLHSLLGTSVELPFILGKLAAGVLVEIFDLSYLVVALVGAGLVLVPLPFLTWLPETPRWLLSKFKTAQAKDLLVKISQTNGKDLQFGYVNKPPSKRRDWDGSKMRKYVTTLFISMNDQLKVVRLVFRKYKFFNLFSQETFVFSITFLFSFFLVNVAISFNPKFHNFNQPGDFFKLNGAWLVGACLLLLVEGLIGRRRCLLLIFTVNCILLLLKELVDDSRKSDIPKEDITRAALLIVTTGGHVSKLILTWFILQVFPVAMRDWSFGLFMAFSGLSEIAGVFATSFLSSTQAGPHIIIGMLFLVGAWLSYYLPDVIWHQSPENLIDVAIQDRTRRQQNLVKLSSNIWQ